VPRRRLAFTANVGQPVSRSTPPGVACFPALYGAAVTMDQAFPVGCYAGKCGNCCVSPAYHEVKVRYALEHVTAVRHVEHAILEGQLLARPDPVVDLQAAGGRMLAGSLNRYRRGTDADHAEPKTRELFSKKTAPAADVQGSQASSPAVVLLGQDLMEVGEAARVMPCKKLSGLRVSIHGSCTAAALRKRAAARLRCRDIAPIRDRLTE
jgi:hypothetical protein